MAKNKKPRKKYVKRYGLNNWSVDKQYYEDFNSGITDFSMIVEGKLRAGNCDDFDIATIRNFFHWAVIALYTREEYTEESRSVAIDLIDKAGSATTEMTQRARKTNGHLICTSEELELIQDACQFVEEFFRSSVQTDPVLVLKEWAVMNQNSLKAIQRKTFST